MTTNHGYNTPAEGSTDWHIPLNENFERMDTDTEIRDISDNLGDYSPKEHAKFLAIDTGEVYLGNGSDWSYLGDVAPEQSGDGGGSAAYVDVRDHGASTSADDNTEAIQSAIDAAIGSDTPTVLLPGYYELDPDTDVALTVDGDVDIFGRGDGTGVFNRNVVPGGGGATFEIQGAYDVHIRDLLLRGTQTDDATSTGNQDSSGTHVANVTDTAPSVSVSNVTALDSRTFVGLDGPDGSTGALNVENCIALNNSRCFSVVGFANVNISNVVHKRHPIGGRDGFAYRTVFLDGVENANVSNVTGDGIGADSGSGTAVNLSAEWGAPTSPNRINIHNCTFRARDGATTPKGIMIMSAGTDMRNVNITNVHCEGFEASVAFWTKSGHRTVNDVTFTNVTGRPLSGGAAIYAKNDATFDDITFRDCRFYGQPIEIEMERDDALHNWTFDGGIYDGGANSHLIGPGGVVDFTFDDVRFESTAPTTVDVRGVDHGRLQFINCDVAGGGLAVDGADRLEVMMGRYPTLDVGDGVDEGWIRNVELTDGTLSNTAGLPTANVDSA